MLLPEAVQHNLADFWAISTVLGISDPHPGNWLYDKVDHMIVGIDLAFRSGIFEKGMAKIPWLTLMSPLGPASFSKEHFIALKEAISQPLRQILSSLSLESLQAIARRTEPSFALTDVQAVGMINRAKILIE